MAKRGQGGGHPVRRASWRGESGSGSRGGGVGGELSRMSAQPRPEGNECGGEDFVACVVLCEAEAAPRRGRAGHRRRCAGSTGVYACAIE